MKAWIFRFLSSAGVAALTGVQAFLQGADFSELGVWAAVGFGVSALLITVIGKLVAKLQPKEPEE